MASVRVIGIEELHRAIDGLRVEVQQRIAAAMAAVAAAHLRGEALSRVPVRLGTLAAGITVQKERGAGAPHVYVSSGRSRVAHLIEYGVRPHKIVPNLRRRLRDARVNAVLASSRRAAVQRFGHAAGYYARNVLRLPGPRYVPSAQHRGFAAHAYMRLALELGGEHALRLASECGRKLIAVAVRRLAREQRAIGGAA